jgi:hypothetical protein
MIHLAKGTSHDSKPFLRRSAPWPEGRVKTVTVTNLPRNLFDWALIDWALIDGDLIDGDLIPETLLL